jgi:hypothetical protein
VATTSCSPSSIASAATWASAPNQRSIQRARRRRRRPSSLIPGLDGIGGENGDNSHAPGEWAELQSFPMLTKRAAILLYRLTR